jgi:hypothetical protein
MASRRAYVDCVVSDGGNVNVANAGDRIALLLLDNPVPGLIESRSDEGPAGVEEDGDADGEGEGFVTGHSMGFGAKRFNVGLMLPCPACRWSPKAVAGRGFGAGGTSLALAAEGAPVGVSGAPWGLG